MTREEAIEIYKGLMNPNIIEAFEVLVPELKEIGYDRMREQIIRGFENWKSNGNLTFNNLRVDDILDWFEKQKEHKPVPISCGHENGTPAEVCYGPKGDPDPAGVWKPSEEQPEVDLEKASRNVYESWIGGTMNDVRRDMVELGKVLNARKEETK